MNDVFPPPAFCFRVTSSDSDPGVIFQEVSGVESEISIESYEDSGENRFAHQLPKAIKHHPLELKRGVAPMNSPFLAWCRAIVESTLANPIVTKNVVVDLVDGAGTSRRSWTFTNAYPIKWEIDPFNAVANEVSIEKITLSYDSCSRR